MNRLIFLSAIVLVVVSCKKEQPSLVISSPANNSLFYNGDTLLISVTATAIAGEIVEEVHIGLKNLNQSTVVLDDKVFPGLPSYDIQIRHELLVGNHADLVLTVTMQSAEIIVEDRRNLHVMP